jgi:Fe-S oxidoreductase
VLDFDAERELLAAMHVDLQVPDSGCCGLAGSFGYEADHYDISMAIGERVLLPAVRDAARDALIVADGFSCREQIEHGTAKHAQHVAEVIALAIRRMHDVSAMATRQARRPASAAELIH